MSDIVRPSKETYDSVLRESYNLWSSYLDADDSGTLPFHCIELRNILSQTPSFLAHGILPANESHSFDCVEKGTPPGPYDLFVKGKSKWETSNGLCDLELKVTPHQLLLAIQTPLKVEFADHTPFTEWPKVQGLHVHDEGNYVTVLLLAWTYILSVRWTELLSRSSDHQCTVEYQREWVLAPFEHAIEDFEKSKIQTIEIDALIEYGETLYDDECRKRLQEAFRRIYGKCILQWTSSAPQIPSTSTKKRLENRYSLSSRKKARNSAPQHSDRESDLFSSGAPQTMLNTSVDSNIPNERQCIDLNYALPGPRNTESPRDIPQEINSPSSLSSDLSSGIGTHLPSSSSRSTVNLLTTPPERSLSLERPPERSQSMAHKFLFLGPSNPLVDPSPYLERLPEMSQSTVGNFSFFDPSNSPGDSYPRHERLPDMSFKYVNTSSLRLIGMI